MTQVAEKRNTKVTCIVSFNFLTLRNILFFYLAVPGLVATCGIFRYNVQTLSRGLWDTVPQPGM